MSSDLLNELINGISLDSIPDDDLHILGDILEGTVCSSASVLSMLLNVNASLTVANIEELKNIQDAVPVLGQGVSAEINYEAGVQGTNLLFFKNSDVAVFANIVMGAELKDLGENPQLGQLQISAFSEIISQFSSKITTNLTSVLETKIGALSPAVKKQKGEKLEVTASAAESPVILVTYNLNFGLERESYLYQILTLPLALDVVEKFKEAKIPNYSMMKEYTDTPIKSIEETLADPYEQTPITVQPVKFSAFDTSPQIVGDGKNLDLLMDIKLKLTVELGRTEMPIKKVLELSRGSVIELDKIAGEPVELYANGKLIANGEVVVIEDNFGLRITSILSPDHRLKNL